MAAGSEVADLGPHHVDACEIHHFSKVSDSNRLRTRRDLARDKFDDAAVAIRSGFQMGKAVGEWPVVLRLLVGINSCQRSVGGCNDFIGRPVSPNLYWALESLPRPLSCRARQKALTVCPDRFQASMVARQARTFSGRCADMPEYSLGENSQTT